MMPDQGRIRALKHGNVLFAFDLDSTVTRCELLPRLAQRLGIEAQMAKLTERAMAGSLPFSEDFPRRAALLKELPLHLAQDIAADVPLNEAIADFLRKNSRRCLIVTGNLDVFIEKLLRRMGMDGRCLCSEALTDGDRLLGVSSVLDKAQAAKKLPHPFIAVGDGSNDLELIRAADFGIAFGGVRRPSDEIRAAADWVTDDEEELCRFLQQFL